MEKIKSLTIGELVRIGEAVFRYRLIPGEPSWRETLYYNKEGRIEGQYFDGRDKLIAEEVRGCSIGEMASKSRIILSGNEGEYQNREGFIDIEVQVLYFWYLGDLGIKSRPAEDIKNLVEKSPIEFLLKEHEIARSSIDKLERRDYSWKKESHLLRAVFKKAFVYHYFLLSDISKDLFGSLDKLVADYVVDPNIELLIQTINKTIEPASITSKDISETWISYGASIKNEEGAGKLRQEKSQQLLASMMLEERDKIGNTKDYFRKEEEMN